MKKLLSMLLILVIVSGMAGCSEKPADINECYEVIIEMAKAYDRQGGQIPYDQYHSRRSIYSSPEDATAQRTIFLDCSSYVNSCYREGFGVNILPYDETEKSPNTANYDEYARENGDARDVIGYWDTAEYTEQTARDEVADWVYENIKIGDIVNYRRGNKGHVYIYIGEDTFMHCAGAGSYLAHANDPSLSHDNNPNETEGTIDTMEFDRVFRNTESSRYIFKEDVTSFGILRPFARGLKPTKEARARMKIAGLSMEKTSSVCENSAVYSGSHLTYTVTLENTVAALNGVKITDKVPAGTKFVSGDEGVLESGGKITWTGDVADYATVKVNYTVEITETKAGTPIVSGDTYVSDVKLGTITHSVSTTSADKQALIAQTAIDFANGQQKFETAFDMVKAVYKDKGLDLSAYNTAGEVLDKLIDTEKLTRADSNELSDMVAPNMYGGLLIKTGWAKYESENDKVRLPKEENLSVGDIILADWSGGDNVYFYAGNKTLITVKDGVCRALTIGPDIFTEGENILISLLGYDRYAVLRPTMQELSVSGISSLSVTKPPVKTNYDIDEPFDTTGMVVTATLEDGTTATLTNYELTPKIFSADDKNVTVTVGDKTATVDVTVSDKKFVYDDISTVMGRPLDETVNVEGIVVGVAIEGKSNDEELLIKDINDDAVIAVRELGGSYTDFYDYKVGDRIIFRATIKEDTSTSTCYKDKKYLEYSSENDKESTVISSGNKVTYNFDKAVEVKGWGHMLEFFNKKTNTPYTYLKIDGGFWLNYYNASDTDVYRLHNNQNATKSSDIKADGVQLCLRDDVMEINLGKDWKKLMPFENSTEYPGTFVDKDIYALYIGGNSSYYQLVILDPNWIS